MSRLPITKTPKVYVGGAFIRSESNRTFPLKDAAGAFFANIPQCTRKDVRNAVEAAAKAGPGWAKRTPYNRGQIIYRLAEMTEARRAELRDAIALARTAPRHPPARPPARPPLRPPAHPPASERALSPEAEVTGAVDRLVAFAGWADKFSALLGSHNAVNGPFYNFTIAEPVGVVALVAPDEPALLGLVSLLAPALCAGNTVVALASGARPVPACVFAECCATSDIPPGVVNILTSDRAELLPHIASHRDIDGALAAALSDEQSATLRAGAGENLKRITILPPAPARRWLDDPALESPWILERLVEMKTVWHPSAT